MQKLKVLELFGGIGACSAALKRLDIDYEIVDYVEIDKYAVKSYNAIHNTKFEPQDISEWNKNLEVDLIMHGSPCQDFSLAGKNAGGDEGSGTRSSLMYETIRIVENLKPKYVVWENVKNLLSKTHRHNFDAYLDKMQELGYTNYYQVLNAKDYGIPQNRERVFTISILNNKGFEFPIKQELKLKLKDMLEDEVKVDEKYYLTENQMEQIEKWKSFRNPIKAAKYLDDETISCITAKGNTSLNASMLLIKNATKQGYLEAHNGDGVYISNIDKKRGTVQKEMIPTLKTSPDIGVVVNRNLKQELCNKLIEENKVQEMDVIRHSYSNSRLEEWNKRNVESNNIVPTLDTRCDCLGVTTKNQEQLRIRKLTPKECWKLMGFNETEFEKAAQVNSNAQLYKQAGNSIVVNVLVEIFKNLLKKGMIIMEKKEEVKIVSYETNLMIDLEKLSKEEPELFEELVKDYPVKENTKIIIEVKS